MTARVKTARSNKGVGSRLFNLDFDEAHSIAAKHP